MFGHFVLAVSFEKCQVICNENQYCFGGYIRLSLLKTGGTPEQIGAHPTYRSTCLALGFKTGFHEAFPSRPKTRGGPGSIDNG